MIESECDAVAGPHISSGTLLRLHDLYTSLPHSGTDKYLLLYGKKGVETPVISLAPTAPAR